MKGERGEELQALHRTKPQIPLLMLCVLSFIFLLLKLEDPRQNFTHSILVWLKKKKKPQRKTTVRRGASLKINLRHNSKNLHPQNTFNKDI